MRNYRIGTNTNSSSNMTTQHKTNKKQYKQCSMDQFRLLTLKYEVLKISVYIKTAFTFETHLAERQWLEEQVPVVKLRMFRVGTRRTAVSRIGGKYLVSVRYLLRPKHQSNYFCYEVLANLICPINYHNVTSRLEKIYCGKGLYNFFICAQVYCSPQS
jgi:hypothetical protein